MNTVAIMFVEKWTVTISGVYNYAIDKLINCCGYNRLSEQEKLDIVRRCSPFYKKVQKGEMTVDNAYLEIIVCQSGC